MVTYPACSYDISLLFSEPKIDGQIQWLDYGV